MKKIKGCIVMMSFFSLVGLCACGGEGTSAPMSTTDEKNTDGGAAASYEQISQEEAKRIMDSESDFYLIDARTEEEFAEGHIKGAILIPEYEIADRAEKEIPEKDALILVYCRSGRRSKEAAQKLCELGYINIVEFGGIIDWTGDTVSG